MQKQEGDSAFRDEKPRTQRDAQGDASYADRDAGSMFREQSPNDDQAHEPPLRNRDWSSRIRASIARLMEIDGISMNPENSAKVDEENNARMAEQAFNERVDQLEAATATAHKEYWRHMYSVSNAKKMRLTSAQLPPPATAMMQPRNDHKALDALAVAAASGMQDTKELTAPPATKVKKSKRTRNLLHNSMLLRDRDDGIVLHDSMALEDGAGTKRSPVQVHDPVLARAVDDLTNKLKQLLFQLQATSDAVAAEPILAAAATIALEASEMRRCEEAALARMLEIEEHRLQIMQGLLEYEKRKEKRRQEEEMNKENEEKCSALDALTSNSSSPPRDEDIDVDGHHS